MKKISYGKAFSLNEFLITYQHQATASDLPFYDVFASTKNFSFEFSDDVIAYELWFGPPQSKILATPMVLHWDIGSTHEIITFENQYTEA